jgi:hypothetical protein
MLALTVSHVESLFVVTGGIVVQKKKGLNQDVKIRNAIKATGHTNIHEILAPSSRVIAAKDDPLQIPSKGVEDAVKKADMETFRELYGIDKDYTWYKKEVFRPLACMTNAKVVKKNEDICSLLGLVLQTQSQYNKAFGGTNQRPHVISAMRGMDDEKVVRIISKHSRPTDVITDSLKKVMDHVPEALDYMYNSFDVVEKFGKCDPVVTMERTRDLYLGAAAGFFLGPTQVKEVMEDVLLEVNPSGKKIHAFQPVMKASQNFWTGMQPIPVIFTQSWKTETKYSWVDQIFTETWEKFVGKARTFEIGNEFFIVQEKVCQTVRMLLERWGGICIGMKWPRGGAHEFAKQFGIEPGLESFNKLGDGDFSALDQTIHYVFLQLFYTMGGVYFDPKGKHYKVMVRILEYVARQISARVVHLCARMWAVVIGKMPTGAWMTAHGNSWIVCLYYYLFCVMQSYKMRPELRERFQLSLMQSYVQAKVYGDDHILKNKRDYEIDAYIGEIQFATWVARYVGATIRDVRTDVPFVSEKGGMGQIKKENIVMLKQFFVRNRSVGHEQADYLPHRAARDFAIRAVWGSTVRKRDIYDIILSTVGHAYGTYASNYHAWVWLKKLHVSATNAIPKEERERTLGMLTSRIETPDHVKRMRQSSITIEQMVGAFPSYELLEEKNRYDPIYHITCKTDTLND